MVLSDDRGPTHARPRDEHTYIYVLVRYREFDPVTLDALMQDTFISRGFGTITFVRAPTGEITGLKNGDTRTRGLVYTRCCSLRGANP